MQLELLDWLIVALYVLFALGAGVLLSRRAGANVNEFFLAGRKLPWWIAGTSMIATSFAADTPLVVTGWVRDHGIWKNWLWWGYAISGFMAVFLFSRYWRRGEVMTTAELSELRYGGREAGALRGVLGFYHAFIKNELVLSWVLLAAMKIMDVLIGADPLTSITILCVIALGYSILAGLWGVVMTDMLQFGMAVAGALFLAVIAWNAVEGIEGLVANSGALVEADVLAFFPSASSEGFWTPAVASVFVYLGIAWWATDLIDGGSIAVQRIAAAKDERHGMLAMLWFNVGHYALRPWPWILVALASIPLLPAAMVTAPADGVVTAIDGSTMELETVAGPVAVDLRVGDEEYWQPVARVAVDDQVAAGSLLASTDSERAYPAMMARFLPVGLLGLVVASLLAAFMSTIDTHVNLASSFFVNDVYRRFLKPEASATHLVLVARLASAGALALGALVAWQAESMSKLFEFFLALMAGVGPVYALRWLWWRVTAWTEITAMVSSAVASIALKQLDLPWGDTPLTPGGELGGPGLILGVVSFSMLCTGLSLVVTRPPDPARLVAFYRRVRPMGSWGPVRALAPDVEVPREGAAVLAGVLGGLAATYGALFGIGHLLLGARSEGFLALGVCAVGIVGVRHALARLETHRDAGAGRS